MDRRTIGTKNCGEVAAIERWPLVEVRLYYTNIGTLIAGRLIGIRLYTGTTYSVNRPIDKS